MTARRKKTSRRPVHPPAPRARRRKPAAKVMRAVKRPWEAWIRTPADEAAVEEGCLFDLAAAEKVREFFRRFLRHSKGQWAGQPFELLEWQWADVIAPLFGWKRADKTRRYRKAYIEIPKKNGKSTLASGVGLYLLAGDNEQGAEVFSAGSDTTQASIVHNEAINMVESSTELSRHLSINHTTRNIAYLGTRSFYRAISAKPAGKEGLNAHGTIIDELHVWYGRELWDTLKYAGRSRRQPLQFVITTAGDDMQSVCREQHDYSEMVLKGEVKDLRHFGYIRSAELTDDWKDPAVWAKANPSLDVTIDREEFAADVAEAEKTASTQASFKRYSLNIWATSTNPWLKIEYWAACKKEFTRADLAGRECYAAVDLSSTDDMTAAAYVFPPPADQEGGVYHLLVDFWMPHDSVHDKDRPHYLRDWAARGLLRVTPGNVVDYTCVKERLKEVAESVVIRELAYDPIYAELFTQEVEAELGIPRVKFPQTLMNFAGPTKEFEKLVMKAGIRHNGDPILAWQAGHVQVYSDANMNMRPVKPKKHDRRKIDGIVASIMALARGLVEEKQTSVYDEPEKELLVL